MAKSHPAWVCGLKHCLLPFNNSGVMSHPAWVCGLKQCFHGFRICRTSHTLRGCVDWNQNVCILTFKPTQSHPAWVCGLKLRCFYTISETLRHTLRGCVDWNFFNRIHNNNKTVTPCVGVWIETQTRKKSQRYYDVTPCVGVWIETIWVL